MEERTLHLLTDGRRLDVQLSEEAGISRSRAAALMEEGHCLLEGKPCLKAGTKPPAGPRAQHLAGQGPAAFEDARVGNERMNEGKP